MTSFISKRARKSVFFATVSCLLLSTLTAGAFEWALYGANGSRFHNGIASSYSTDVHKHGYIDASGKLIIPYIYNMTLDFNGVAAEVTTDEGCGLINRKGEFIIEPGNYFFYRFEEAPDLMRIEDKNINKQALFDGTRFITGYDYDFIDFYGRYPFIQLSNRGGGGDIYNVLSQEFFYGGRVINEGDYFEVLSPSGNFVFDLSGEPVNGKKLKQSSKNVEIFRDSITDKVGLRNATTKQIIQPARFKTAFNNREPLWLADVITLFDSISPSNKFVETIIGSDGKNLFVGSPDSTFIIDSDFIMRRSWDFQDKAGNVYYDFTGKELTELRGTSFYPIGHGLFYDSTNKRIYDKRARKFMENSEYPSISEGMLSYRNLDNDKRYFKNLSTGKLLGPYDYAYDFAEGAAVVEKDDVKFVIDKNGREYKFPKGIELRDERFSEGVIAAYDDDNSIYGFIYNPVGHAGWVYNQKSGQLSDYGLSHLDDQASELFKQKKYAAAMNKYYQMMMLRPDEKSSFGNYAVCLYNLGNYEEALTAIDVALEYWPDFEYALNLRSKIVEQLEAQAAAEEDEDDYVEENSYSVWDAIGNFANALAGAFGSYNPSMAYTPSYSYDSSYSSGASSSGGNYQTQYDNWARRAESNYNSLTNLGYSATSKSGKKSGSAGGKVSSGNYVKMKRLLREAQNEMRSIRRKAAKEGITIVESRWETATVGY